MSELTLSKDSVISLPRGVRIQKDKVRERTVLVAPERTVALDDVGVAILELLDGKATLSQIVDTLAAKYNAPKQEIGNDVVHFVKDLHNRGYLEIL